MKKNYILLLLCLFFISGCENKEEIEKNEYIAMKGETFNEKNYKQNSLSVDITTNIDIITEEEISYKTTITNPKENMHDV